MPIHITVDNAATKVAEQYARYTNLTPASLHKSLPTFKYNSLAVAFNASTVLLVVAVASAMLLAPASAVAYGAIALAVRTTVGQELEKYAMGTDVQGMLQSLLRSEPAPNEARATRIFIRTCGSNVPTGWIENEVDLFGYFLWKNLVPV